jgi:uncharacterized repeat protein (TIGR01451 family)
MTLRHPLLPAFALMLVTSAAFGQAPPPLPPPGPAPLLYVRFSGPPGQRVSFFRGTNAITFDAPVTVGLRPGYLYRVKITGWPDHRDLTLYPSLEVRGSLCLPPKLSVANYPAPIQINEADIQRILTGSLVTKVIYLEDPEKALPTAARADQPAEYDFPPGFDLMEEARERGRPMVIVRLGQRQPPAEELVKESIPGTFLLPGEKVLPAPRVPPWVPWACVNVFDPTLGPKPLTEECLHDGGDTGAKAGIDAAGRLVGVDPSDTVAEYVDSKGRRHVTCSNRVCLCVPRFAVLRTECPLARHEAVLAPGGAHGVQGQAQVELRLPSQAAFQYEQLLALQGRKRPTEAKAVEKVIELVRVEVLEAHQIEIGPAALLGSTAARQLTEVERVRLLRQLEFARELSQKAGVQEAIGSKNAAVLGRVQGLDVISTAVETRDITVCCNEVPCPPDKPLCLFKWADAKAAQVGDVVTFYLKYSNHGGQPIDNIAVVDSLTGRLEYVPGSARSDRAAVFTLQENEAGARVLRWEISGRLLPGASGVVSFQARIR